MQFLFDSIIKSLPFTFLKIKCWQRLHFRRSIRELFFQTIIFRISVGILPITHSMLASEAAIDAYRCGHGMPRIPFKLVALNRIQLNL